MGLLITVLAVGVVKLKSVATRELSEDGEVELGWDDCSAGSAAVETNITINPLEVITVMDSYKQLKQLETRSIIKMVFKLRRSFQEQCTDM